MLDIQKLIDAGEEYYEKVKDQASREASWKYCYEAFLSFRGKILSEENKEYLALHLTTYLASWGMYRGSSFLLQEKNYKVHIGVINILFEKRYDVLWNMCNKEHLDLLMALKEEINKHYSEQRIDSQRDTTDTLVTKILLGTLGCAPAYDTNLCVSLKMLGIPTSFRKESVCQIIDLYEKYRNEFELSRQKAIKIEGISDYPIMKILDACLWQLADVSKEQKVKELDNGKEVHTDV